MTVLERSLLQLSDVSLLAHVHYRLAQTRLS